MTEIKRGMEWDSRAFRALVRAFAPMPPGIREKTLQRIVEEVEKFAQEHGADKVEAHHVHAVSREILKTKAEYMYRSLVDSFRAEGLEVGR